MLNKTNYRFGFILKTPPLQSLMLTILWGLVVCIPSPTFGASIPPALIESAKKMTPAQRKALAAEYGIDIGSKEMSDSSRVPQSGQELPPEALLRPAEGFNLNDSSDPTELDLEDKKSVDLPRFGARLFEVDQSMYEPQEVNSVPQNYLFGPGDQLLVNLFGKVSSQYEISVEADGSLIVPDVGSFQVAGLTLAELKRLASNVVEERLIGTEIFITPSNLRKVAVVVVGEVKKPGQYLLSSVSNFMHALYLAGGPTDIGSFRDITVEKTNSERLQVDLYSILLNGRGIHIPLDDGDTIHVPPLRSEVKVDGEVRRPGRYEIKDNTTVSDVLGMAGGVTANAFEKGILLQRFDSSAGAPSILQIDSFENSVVLQNGDEVRVRAGSEQPVNPVKISGAVSQPGVYQFREQARVGDYLTDLQADYLLESDLQMGLIVRRINAEQDIRVLAFSPVVAASNSVSTLNPFVEVYDELVILPLAGLLDDELSFKLNSDLEVSTNLVPINMDPRDQGTVDSKTEFSKFPSREELIGPLVAKLKRQASPGKPAETVTIYGAVNEPGEYPLISGDRAIEFLLSLAGGVQDGAFLGSVELRRRAVSERGVINLVQNVNLSTEASYLPEAADELRINFLPGWRLRETATVKGEVQFPGEYALTPGETIASLIKRAGGFTNQAFVEAVRFRSATAREQQQLAVDRALTQIRKTSSLTETDGSPNGAESSEISESALVSEVEGRIVIDMPRILAGDESADIAVQNGDEIFVPRASEVVYVVGDVLEPGNYRHVRGTTLDQYISLAAGYTATAKKKDVYFILPNGRVQRVNDTKRLLEFGRSSSEIVAGTTIVVPPNLDYSPPLEFYTQVSSVVFQSMASIAAFFNLARN